MLYKSLFICCLFSVIATAQVKTTIEQSNSDDFQFGGALKLTFEVQKFTNFRLSIAAGAGKKIEGLNYIYPAINTEIQLYNGGIGSSLLYSKQRQLILDFIISFNVTGGIREVGTYGYATRYNPLNYFSDLSAKPLQNPYYNSLSLGSNYIISSDKNRENQLIGIFNLNVERTFQFTYYNDGTPFRNTLGDGYDRYYTGGGIFSYYGNYNDAINHIALSYHKFTGYQRNAFEMANHLQIDFIPYKDVQAFYYNQSRWRFAVGNYDTGFSGHVSIYDNPKLDVQDYIHLTIDNAYHPNTFNKPRWAFGFDYNYVNWNSK
ncbi:hypothetical protein [Olleya sp. R77988]|uniref:hypothetical protein n=1 Tax=Olleya sp. R77988 TaxID=3093875 RepID=UPI0037C950BB